jgi:sarcosine oxidase subunit beta
VNFVETFDHVIVGGGILGASVAYHLARQDTGSVLLLERNDLASAASSQAAGLLLQASTRSCNTALAKLTRDTIPVLEDELGEKVGFHEVGSLRIAASEERVSELEVMVADANNWQIPFNWISPTEAGAMISWLDPSPIVKAAFLPSDGYIDPYLLSMMYIRAARARGVIIRPRTEVIEILLRGNKATGVSTSAGQIACSNVIDAGGAWAALLSAGVGYPLPMAPVRSHYWISEPDSLYGGEHPVTIIPDVAAYTRPEVGGLLVGIQEPQSATFNARDLPKDPNTFSPTKGEEHWDLLIDASGAVAQFFPDIMGARFSSYVCGLSSYTPDGNILLGPVPGIEGLLAAAGDCGSGITLSAGIGDAIANLALGQEPAFDITSFSPGRFGPVNPFSKPFRQRCAAARAAKSRQATQGRLK